MENQLQLQTNPEATDHLVYLILDERWRSLTNGVGSSSSPQPNWQRPHIVGAQWIPTPSAEADKLEI